MDFATARSHWEHQEQTVPTPVPLPVPIMASRAVQAPNSAGVRAQSDYSDVVGDYMDDRDFFDAARVEPGGATLAPNERIEHEHVELDDDDDDDDERVDVDAQGSFSGSHSEEMVRQHSNFSRLSAQSWLTVDSAEDVDVDGDAAEFLLRKETSTEAPPASASASAGPASAGRPPHAQGNAQQQERKVEKTPEEEEEEDEEDDPMRDNREDAHRLLERVRAKPLVEKSVFECAVELLAGMAAYKKKSFRRFGARRVWLSADCDHLCWTSKKDGVDSDHIELQRVVKLKCVEREIAVDVIDGYRISLLFSSSDEAGLWARCLSCLIPLQARVRAPPAILLKDKDREDFNLVDDVFDSVPLRDHFTVNAYAIIGPVKGHSGHARLAFSRADRMFVGIRYVPRRLTPLLLRSFEEIAVLKRLSHPNIVQYSECLLYQNRGGSFVVFEHQARGMIMDASRLEGVSPIPERAARELMRDVISALEYLHSLQIAHGDVRPDNLLRAVNGSVKLNPLGCITHEFTEVKSMSALVRARLGGASPAFLAPELCWRGNGPKLPPKSYAMDVWAVGAVLYFMLYGRVPFGGKDHDSIQENICEGKLRFPRHPETSRQVRNLLKGVLGEKDPRTRIALSELKVHPWFLEGVAQDATGSPGNTQQFGAAPLVVAPEEVDAAVQNAKVRIPC